MSFPPCFQRFQWCTNERAQACSIVAGKWETCRFPATSAILWCSSSSMPLSSSKTTSWDTLCPFISTTTLEKKKRKRVSYCVPVFVISSVPRFFYHFFVACIEPLLSRVCDLNAVLVIFDSNVWYSPPCVPRDKNPHRTEPDRPDIKKLFSEN